MDPFRLEITRNLGMIVDDQGHSTLRGDFAQFPGKLFNFDRRIIFRAQLQEINAAGDERFGHFPRPFALDVTEIEDRIEPAAIKIIGSQTRAYSWSRAGIGLISNSSEFITRSTKPVS